MIKRRQGAQRSLRQKEEDVPAPTSPGATQQDDTNAAPVDVDDLILFRKWKRKQGQVAHATSQKESLATTSTSQLKRMRPSTSNVDQDEANMWRLNEGGLVDLEQVKRSRYERGKEEDTADADAGSATKRIGAAFTASTNVLDTEKHMYAFIEAELQRQRQAGATGSGAQQESQDDDVKDSSGPQHVKASEDSAATSRSMQVGIAEVDLGPSAAKVNALETERALAHLRQAEEAKKKNKAVLDDGGVGARRWTKPHTVLMPAPRSQIIHKTGPPSKTDEASPDRASRTSAPPEKMAVSSDHLYFERYKTKHLEAQKGGRKPRR